MRTFVSVLSIVSLLAPMGALAADANASVNASLQILKDQKQNTNFKERSRRGLLKKVRNQMLSNVTRFGHPDMTNRAYNTYKNEEYGLRIGYPGDWKVLPKFMNTIVSFLSPATGPDDALTENINISAQTYDTGNVPLLTDATDKAIGQLKQLSHFKILDLDKNAIIGTGKAVSIVYAAAGDGGQMLRFKQIWLLKGNTLFVFTFAASSDTFRDYVKVFDKMIGTLSLN